MVKWFHCFIVALMMFCLIMPSFAEGQSPQKIVDNFLKATANGQISQAESCLSEKAKIKDEFGRNLAIHFFKEFNGNRAVRGAFKLIKKPHIISFTMRSDSCMFMIEYVSEGPSGRMLSRVERRADLTLRRFNGNWQIDSCIFLTMRSYGLVGGKWLDDNQLAERLKKAQPQTSQRLQERRRKEQLADELRNEPQKYVDAKIAYVPLIRGWSKSNVENAFGKMPRSSYDLWNYLIWYQERGFNKCIFLDVYFIDGRVYKVIGRSESIADGFSHQLLDAKLNKITFSIGDEPLKNKVHVTLGNSWILLLCNSDCENIHNGLVKKTDVAPIWNYFEVPSYWQSFSNGVEGN